MPQPPHASKTQKPEVNAPSEAASPDLEWHRPDAAPLTLSGFPWYASDGVFRRLPLDPVEPLPPSVRTAPPGSSW